MNRGIVPLLSLAAMIGVISGASWIAYASDGVPTDTTSIVVVLPMPTGGGSSGSTTNESGGSNSNTSGQNTTSGQGQNTNWNVHGSSGSGSSSSGITMPPPMIEAPPVVNSAAPPVAVSTEKGVQPTSTPSSVPPVTGSRDTTIQPNSSAPREIEKASVLEMTQIGDVSSDPQTKVIDTRGGIQKERPKTSLDTVSTSLHQLQKEIRSVNEGVRSAVAQDVDKALFDATALNASEIPTSTERVFSKDERDTKIEELKKAVMEKQGQLSHQVESALSSSKQGRPLEDIGPVLKSSLKDIELLVKNETGTTIDLSPTARKVETKVTEQTPQFTEARDAFLSRGGLDLYTDSDHDSISNYDETHIYHTDPHNAFTSGSVLTDGERVLLGLAVNSTSTEHVPVESPIASGQETKNIFSVDTIEVKKGSESSSDVSTAMESVTFAGKALPNSFVTLYVFSTPVVVTVKTDNQGSWRYTLTSELPNGDHRLYVATVDAGGKILAKSPVISFTKTAEAASFTPLLIAETPTTDPLDILRQNMLLLSLFGFAVFGLIALGIVGMRHKDAPPGPSSLA